MPVADPDREVIWTVDGNTVRFDLSALRAKPPVASGTDLDSSNSVVFSVGSTLCMLARTAASETAASQFLFSADRADTYSVELAVSSIDLEPWARRSNATKVAAANLPSPWLTQAQVDARVRALTGMRILYTGPAVQMHIPNTDNSKEGAFTVLSPTFDLDDNPAGALRVVMTVNIDNVAGIGFGALVDPVYTFEAVVLASKVSEQGTYVRGGAIEGVEIGSRVNLYDDTDRLGVLAFYLAKNANNELGYLFDYSGAGVAGLDVPLGASMEVSFSPTDAPAAATSSTGHVGPLIAKLAIPAGPLAADARPNAAWVVQSGVPGFDVTGRSNGELNVPRKLPDDMAGVVVRTKVGTSATNTVSQVFLPWVPIHKDVAWDARIGPGTYGRNVFQLLASDDSTVRTVKLVLQRQWTGDKDMLFVAGNAERIKADTTIELLQWV